MLLFYMFMNGPVAQLDRVLASGAKGRGFKSRLAYHKRLDFTAFSVFVSKSVSKIAKTEPLLRLCFLSPVIESELHADLRVPLHDLIVLIFPDGAHRLVRLPSVLRLSAHRSERRPMHTSEIVRLLP